jgi:[acyl-carrier-protein] S-malonyltransferase
MERYAFLFPGQGAQTPGMMKDVCERSKAARDCLNALTDAAGEDVSKLLWETDAETLSRSDRSQLAIVAASLIAAAALKERGIVPAACAGFSLGEFPAFYASGVLSFTDTVSVVKKRGVIMQTVCDAIAKQSHGRPPGMAAVIGLAPEKVSEIAASCAGVYAANFNSRRQTVVSGTADGLDEAEPLFKAAGARRVLRLPVAGPFHSPLMQDAATEFEQAIAGVPFNDPVIPFFSNVSGKQETSGADLKKFAVLHLISPLLWTSEEAALGALMDADSQNGGALIGNEWRGIEVGPGTALSGFWRDSEWGEKYAVAK